MDFKEFCKLMNNMEDSFQRFEWWWGYKGVNCRYFNLEILPSLSFFVDNQMNESFITTEGKLIESCVGIGLHFEWITFSIGFQINFKTNKPLSNE
jgi:hypothetical protein